MLYFEEEETQNKQKISMNSLVCVIWEITKNYLILVIKHTVQNKLHNT